MVSLVSATATLMMGSCTQHTHYDYLLQVIFFSLHTSLLNWFSMCDCFRALTWWMHIHIIYWRRQQHLPFTGSGVCDCIHIAGQGIDCRIVNIQYMYKSLRLKLEDFKKLFFNMVNTCFDKKTTNIPFCFDLMILGPSRCEKNPKKT